jgi:hypothetical protein
MWKNPGRFKGKPALTFTNGFGLIAVRNPAALAKRLRTTQQTTVMTWVYLPPTTFSPANGNSALLFWGTTKGYINQPSPRAMEICLPYFSDGTGTGGLVNWYTGGALNNSWNVKVDRMTTPYNTGKQTGWELWCFTKDNTSGVA